MKRHALVDLKLKSGDYPHQATVYRILDPLIAQHKQKTKVINPGSGSWMTVVTRDGQLLKADFSNQIIQCDHTKLDICIVDSDDNLLSDRPWLTTIVDTYSSCIVGFRLWIKQPGSTEVALALRHAILPPKGVTIKPRPIRLCGACYAEEPYHRIEWQYKEKIKCDRHQLSLLTKCTNCETPFPIPADWELGECTHCSLPFAKMVKRQKIY
ncbi:hypothetical protein [Nostoc sp. NOS(2021)]|uniref:hypothetical protein n=1 Tax=Nostoc sp. NOS(2021) TaxID=2815407 RepID=UPI0025DCE746|nr:hypothetical protein [Nostoc sp. NOS(2021)]